MQGWLQYWSLPWSVDNLLRTIRVEVLFKRWGDNQSVRHVVKCIEVSGYSTSWDIQPNSLPVI